MLASNVLLDALASLLASDPTTLAPVANAVHIHLAVNAFTPGPNLLITNFVEATYPGSAAKSAGVGPQQNFVDALTGQRTVQLIEPVGGWHWVATGLTNLPQDVYGIYVTDNADLIVYGSSRFDGPIPISAIGQAIDVPQVRFTFFNPVLG
jgi:hypothetical protein